MKSRKKNKSTAGLTIGLYLRHAFRYKRYAVTLLVTVLVTVLVMDYGQRYLQADILQKISDGNYDPKNLWGSFGDELLLYALAVVSTGILGWRLNIWLIWKLEMHVLRDMAQRVFDHLMSLDANFHANRFGGSLVSQTNKLVGSYVRFADAVIFNLYGLVIGMAATIIILGPRVPIYAATLLVLSVAYLFGTVYFSRPVREANRKQAAQESRQTGQLADSITNIMAVKSFAAEAYESKRYWKEATKTKQATEMTMVKQTYRETFASTMTSLIAIAAIGIAVFGTQTFGTDIATLFLIVTFTGNIGMRLWDFQHVLRQFNRALGDASDMVKILQIKPAISDPSEPEEVAIRRGRIVFDDVTFTHPEKNEPLFRGLNLRIQAGEKIGLVGHSGSGKTSLTSLLLRFADVDKGSITIDGQDIRNIRQADLRRHITYVPQEPLLFHRSLADNIAYSRPDAEQREIEAIAKMANAHDFIKKLPQGYETLVGERGVKLSGGQRQRVAIARAMLKNAPVLVLDEATSALDSESEVLIQEALWKLMEGRTAIVIAHRLSTIQKMDRIIVMDNGKIVEEGSHKDLLYKKGVYAKLWTHQSGGFIDEATA
jgi:ATP-binding cassette subfamily B protein